MPLISRDPPWEVVSGPAGTDSTVSIAGVAMRGDSFVYTDGTGSTLLYCIDIPTNTVRWTTAVTVNTFFGMTITLDGLVAVFDDESDNLSFYDLTTGAFQYSKTTNGTIGVTRINQHLYSLIKDGEYYLLACVLTHFLVYKRTSGEYELIVDSTTGHSMATFVANGDYILYLRTNSVPHYASWSESSVNLLGSLAGSVPGNVFAISYSQVHDEFLLLASNNNLYIFAGDMSSVVRSADTGIDVAGIANHKTSQNLIFTDDTIIIKGTNSNTPSHAVYEYNFVSMSIVDFATNAEVGWYEGNSANISTDWMVNPENRLIAVVDGNNVPVDSGWRFWYLWELPTEPEIDCFRIKIVPFTAPTSTGEQTIVWT
jgi:hypothetical protein